MSEMQSLKTTPQFVRRLDELSNALARICERNAIWVLVLVSAIYFWVVGLIAIRKQLENDELFTLNIAKLPGLSDVWSALLTGAEQMPPFFYVLTRISLSLFGESSLALRLPAMLGFWMMSLCLYRFVAKRSTALYGLLAVLFLFTTGAYYYAFEARPYGLVLGFSGLALICWQALLERRNRLPYLLGLTLSLAAAFSCHYYAVLVLIPFVCGELVRAIQNRRIDLSVWAAMAAATTPLFFYLPLIKSARSYSTGFWAQPSWGDAPFFYYFVLASAALPLTAILLLSALYAAVSLEETPSPSSFTLSIPEIAAAIGFLLIPFVAVTIAMFVTKAFTLRYALSAVLGLGMLIPFAFLWQLRGRDFLLLALLFLLALGFVRRGGMTLKDAADRSQGRINGVTLLQQLGGNDLPIVVSDPHNFLILSHYAPPELQKRLVYLSDPAASRRYFGHDSIERGMFDLLKPYFKLNVQAYRPYLDSGRKFLLLSEPDFFLNWMLTDLPAKGEQLELKGRSQPFLLFLVSPPPGSEKVGASAEQAR